MSARLVRDEKDRELLIRFIQQHKLPFTANIVKGLPRTVLQNRLQRKWLNEISEQLGDQTPEEVRGFCKLAIGVPILRAENEAFCAKYDAIVKPLTYEQKLSIMQEPLDMPVTRLMSTSQKTRYLDGIYKFFAEKGVVLTSPDLQGL